MFSEPVISIKGLGKSYQIYDKPRDRLLQMLVRGRKQFYREFWALKNLELDIKSGEVIGVIGKNGAGKSTFLQLVCGTLTPTCGSVNVRGRVAALLELGAGFNPEFTGRENVHLNGNILGLSTVEIEKRFNSIVDYSGIGDFIDQPVKTYSSGMYIRLAFSVATSVDPDILVIDEALSVGDGEFARRSFDRIMELRKCGTTILFCSHSLYLIEAFCDRAVWLEQGELKKIGRAKHVTAAYKSFLDSDEKHNFDNSPAKFAASGKSLGQILSVKGYVDGVFSAAPRLVSQESTLEIIVTYNIDPNLPFPSVILGIATAAGLTVASASSHEDNAEILVDSRGKGQVKITFPGISLLKGDYYLSVILACETAIHIYDIAERCLEFQITQHGMAQGIVVLPHIWGKS